VFFASRPIIRPRKGVSEVMGALLLIVVVVVAVAVLASFVAVAEKSAQTRQTYLTSVHNDNLQITFAQFTQLTPSASNTMCSGPTPCWASVTLTIRNLNTESSGLSQIEVAGFWADQWEEVDSTGNVIGIFGPQASSVTTTYPDLGAQMPIPARGTVFVELTFPTSTSTGVDNFPPGMATDPLVTQSITITMLSELDNFFTIVYNPPTAIAHVSIASINDQYYNRDVVSLDGSLSTAANQTSIVSYAWNVLVPYADNPSGCTDAAFSTSTQYYAATVTGETTQFLQESSLPTTSSPTVTLSDYCLTGPFEVSLTVTDSRGFTATSSPIIVAPDSNMAPTATFSACLATGTSPYTCNTSGTTIIGEVATIFGTPPALNTQMTIIDNGVSQLTPVNSTGGYQFICPSGTTTTTVQVLLNALPPQTLMCPT
jgi:flagellin-like protein